MEIRELRIGNYCRDSHNYLMIVNAIGKNSISGFFPELNDNGIEDHGKYHPIPLTSEWLERAGFEIQLRDQFNKYFIFDKLKIMDRGKLGFYFYFNEHYVVLNHVHQLQNLYHSLTGTEIEFNPLKQ